ncbi:MAG TPA: hypothetical protein VIX17_03245 [Pyrinomonadaceae bacterium]|jgi:hypothetical protein
MSLPKQAWIGIVAGAILSAPLLFLSFITTFGICFDTSISEALFPFALALDPGLENHIFFVLVLALVQLPLYGMLLGLAWKAWPGRLAFLGALIFLLVGHVAAIRIANSRVETMWQYRFSHIR